MKKTCIRCGECCRRGGPCDIRKWVTKSYNLPEEQNFKGICDLLINNNDGTTTCKGIQSAFDKSLDWYEDTRIYLTTKVTQRGCDCPS